MKIALIACAASVHTVKWANALAAREHQVTLISAACHADIDGAVSPEVRIIYLKGRPPFFYYTAAARLRRILKREGFDVVNTHYASGYGTLARLAGARPMVLSVGGSDVYEFPYQSAMKHRIICKNLLFADALASTSHAMARQVQRVLDRPQIPVTVTPFGVDINALRPRPKPEGQAQGLCIGIIKTLKKNYGIDVLIRAFALLRQDCGDSTALRLVIVGEGEEAAALKALAAELGQEAHVDFVGRIPHSQVPQMLSGFDIFAVCSRRESFGVSLVEAMACGLPTVATDAEGFLEVTDNGTVSLIVPYGDARALADALKRLTDDPDLRRKLGAMGRKRVEEEYDWVKNVGVMEALYRNVIQQYKNSYAGA